MTSQLRYARSLPTYPGSKRNLDHFIFGNLAKHLPISQWQDLILLDPFMGSGAVSMAAKAYGFRSILANDLSHRSQFVAQGLLVNSRVRLTLEDWLYLNQAVPEGEREGFVELAYCPSVFSRRHAKRLDQWLYWVKQIQCPIKRALLLVAIWHTICDFVCFATSIGTSNRPYAEALDGVKSWDEIPAKRFADKSVVKLLKPTMSVLKSKFETVNQGVFGGVSVQAFQMDAVAFLSQVQGDIAYLDPPYPGTLQYEKANRVLDHLLTGDIQQYPPSPYSSSTDTLYTLLEALNHIPIWVLSYGNKEIDLNGLVNLVQSKAGSRKVYGYAKKYCHMRHVSKNADNQELLVIAVPE